MIRETYKGRQLKAIKGKSYGKSRISVNGTECGEWLGTQADVIEWAKRTIDDVDSRPFEGRWNECWYAPGTYELNEIGHVVSPGGVCSCDLCKTEPWNSCQNITAGGVCVCDHCMKPYLNAPTETDNEQAVPATVDADVVRAFEAKADEVANANGWTIARAETVMLRYLRDTSPAEAATIAEALQVRRAA